MGLPVGVPSELDSNATDQFLMYCYKVVPCGKRYRHDWSVCPFAHQGEMAARRDPSKYIPVFCEHAKQRLPCPQGAACGRAHTLYEVYLHPARFRTELCQFGPNCTRPVCFFAHSAEQLRVTGYTGNLNAPSNMDTSQLGVEQQLVLMQLNQLNGVNTPSLGAASSLSASLSVSQQLDAATAAAAGLGGGGGGGLPHHLSASLNGSLSGQLPSVHSGQLLQLGQLNGMASVHSGQLPTMHSASLPVVSSQLSGPLPTVSEQQELIMQLQRQQRQQQQHQQQQQQLASLQQMVKDAAGMQGGGSRGRLSPTTPLLSPHSPNPYTGSPASSGSTSRAASGGTVGAMEGDGGDGGMLASLQAQLSGMQLPGAGSGGLDAAVTSMALPVSAAQQLGGHGGVMMSQPDLSSSEGLLAALAQQLGFMPNGSVAQCTAAQGGGAFGSLYAGPLSMPLPQLTELSPAVAANAALAGLPRGGGGVSSAAHMAGGFGASSADPLVLLSSLPRRGASSAPGSPSGQLEAGLDGALPAPGLGQQAMGMAAAASSTAALQLLPIDDDEDENESQDGEDITERDQVLPPPSPSGDNGLGIGSAEAVRLLANLPADKVAELMKLVGAQASA